MTPDDDLEKRVAVLTATVLGAVALLARLRHTKADPARIRRLKNALAGARQELAAIVARL